MTESLQAVRTALMQPAALCGLFFKNDSGEPINLANYQEEIVSTILMRSERRVCCLATTRAGKSLSVALGIILLAVLVPGRRIRIIAPTDRHTRIIMGYVIQHLFDHPQITASLTAPEGMGAERLRQELSKQKITFRNGSEIMSVTASIDSEGQTLVGLGATEVFVDEVELIPEEIIRSKVLRMLGDTPEPFLFLISNPIQRGFIHGVLKAGAKGWKVIRINWREAVKEGRLTQEFVDGQRAALTPMEFQVWYEAQYPDDQPDTLIKWEWIITALRECVETAESHEKILGVDVARFGTDLTVLTYARKYGDIWVVKEIKHFRQADTMETTGWIRNWDAQENFDRICVDDAGVGGGVTDRLRETESGFKVFPFVAGEQANDKQRFLNRKAEQCVKLARLFETGKITIPDVKELKEQLNAWKVEMQGSTGKLKIVDPDKSPDFADSLMIATYEGGSFGILSDPTGAVWGSTEQGGGAWQA